MTKRILLGLLTIGLVSILTVSATTAYLYDTETSTENTFAAGTLDLTCDGHNGTNSVKFNVANLKPGNQPRGTWNLCNVGSLNGYLDLENITVTSQENGCLEPEIEAGDVTCGDPGPGDGELQDLLGLDLFWDYNCDGWYSAGDKRVFQSSSGPAGSIAGNYDENEPLASGQCVCLTAHFNWWSNRYANDNLGQGDSMELGLTFELAQTAGQ